MAEYNPMMFLTMEDVERIHALDRMIVGVDMAKSQSDTSGCILLIPLTIAQLASIDERANSSGLDRQDYILKALRLIGQGAQNETSA